MLWIGMKNRSRRQKQPLRKGRKSVDDKKRYKITVRFIVGNEKEYANVVHWNLDEHTLMFRSKNVDRRYVILRNVLDITIEER